MNHSTHAIEGLKRYSQGLMKAGEVEDALAVANIISLIHSGTKFLLPENGDVGVAVHDSDMMALVRPPYPVTVFEWSNDMSMPLDPDGAFKKAGVPEDKLITSAKRIAIVVDNKEVARLIGMPTEGQKDGFIIFSVYHFTKDDLWSVVPIGVGLGPDTEIESFTTEGGETRTSFMGNVIRIMPGSIEYMTQMSGSDDKAIEIMLSDVANEVTVAVNALACLNAKNVKSVTIEAPAKLNAKRVKNGKTPFFEYKVLDIFLGDKVRQVQSGSGKRIRMALDEIMKSSTKLCAVRGHFKRRKSGLFWWNMHMRGHQRNGVVEKDYSVRIQDGQ